MFDQAAINDSQKNARAFRAILDAMARPGQPRLLPCLVEELTPAHATSLSILLSLGDHLTSIYLDSEFKLPEIEKLIRFHTGSRLTDDCASADFALLSAGTAGEHLDQWKLGTLEYPDQSTTLIFQTASFTTGLPVEFAGPGLKAPMVAHIADMSSAFWVARAKANAGFPLGLDMIFASPDQILGCPRSSTVKSKGAA